MSSKKSTHVSASFMRSYKKCNWLCFMKYYLGLRTTRDTDTQRFGNRWHGCQEILGRSAGVCIDCAKLSASDPECPFCGGTGYIEEDQMPLVVDYLDKFYADIPANKDRTEWLVERVKVLYGMSAYNWYYSNSQYETVATELKFDLPVKNPKTGRTLPNCKLVGKIDKLVRNQNGIPMIMEHKTTSSSMGSDSTFWENLRLNIQISMYVYAAQQLQLAGDLEPYGIKATDPLIQECVFDGLRKPSIAPKKLSQGDSKKFVGTGEYFEKKFEIACLTDNLSEFHIDGEEVEIEPGAKAGTYAIRETPEMYGMRLLQDMGERPEFYFGRREVSRTPKDIENFQKQICSVYQGFRFMVRNESYVMNEDQCEATYACEYIPICYNGVDPTVGEISGFKRIFEKKENKN
ncbi:hypothetical protein LCGC14_0486980 [marine sediment metagenome]|uniref:PD-(D/E)XK endonuclease-like domain-containing protein n=1 Tax=marine sediment metagenome TaxID=412755 RepID=A0A0F9SCX2_9ZZZZ